MTKMCEVCGENEADYLDHYEEHIPNPREIDVCKSCHSKIHTSWRWILRKEPNACPLAIKFAKDPENVEDKPTYDFKTGNCWYPAQFYKRKANLGPNTSVSSGQKCSEIEDGDGGCDSYLNCNIFSRWYWEKYFKTLEGTDGE